MEKATGDMRRLQLEELEILSFFDKTCAQQGLTYYLAYGTLLGAVRHKGFIPWDDDVDVWMPRGDYMKLLAYLKTGNQDGRFILSDGPYKVNGDRPAELQMRVIDKTVRISRNYAGKQTVMYPWIDVFCLDGFPAQKKKQYFKNFSRQLFFYKIARCKSFLIEEDSLYGKANKLLYTLHNRYHLLKHVLKEEKQKDNVVRTITKYQKTDSENGEEYFCYAAVYLPKPEKCFFSRQWFGQPMKMEFEGQMFSVPQNWDGVLQNLYGDYMTPPPEEQRRCTHESKLIENTDA